MQALDADESYFEGVHRLGRAGGHQRDALSVRLEVGWLGGEACWQAVSPPTNGAPIGAANKGDAILLLLRRCGFRGSANEPQTAGDWCKSQSASAGAGQVHLPTIVALAIARVRAGGCE